MRAPPALAAAAGCAAFGLLSATYDAAAFPQAVYSFLFAAGLTAVLASKRANRSRPRPPIVTWESTSGRLLGIAVAPRRFHTAGFGSGGNHQDPPGGRHGDWRR